MLGMVCNMSVFFILLFFQLFCSRRCRSWRVWVIDLLGRELTGLQFSTYQERQDTLTLFSKDGESSYNFFLQLCLLPWTWANLVSVLVNRLQYMCDVWFLRLGSKGSMAFLMQSFGGCALRTLCQYVRSSTTLRLQHRGDHMDISHWKR